MLQPILQLNFVLIGIFIFRNIHESCEKGCGIAIKECAISYYWWRGMAVKEAELEEYSKFTVGKIGPKSGSKPKIYEWDNFFLQPKCKLGESSSVNIIFLMGFTKVAVQLLDLSLKLISIWALNALQAL